MDILDAIWSTSRLVSPDDDELTAALYEIWNYAVNLTKYQFIEH